MTLFESATRVPLLIRDPRRTHSFGKRTDSPAQLLDMYPTLAALAELPPPGDSVDGVDLTPLFDDPTRQDISEASFSQQARCYQKNAPTPDPTPEQQTLTKMMTCEFVPRVQMDFMGYSMRTRKWRYTEWVKWNGTAMLPSWDDNHGRELYDHTNLTYPFPEWRENVNLAYEMSHKDIVANLSHALRTYFNDAAAKPRV